ncbi:MAG: hypothetical protein LBV34_15095 [Nocardiopsaceae bacterium]|nr:hypothetical protein [Nocardiopsaceae bacterium]
MNDYGRTDGALLPTFFASLVCWSFMRLMGQARALSVRFAARRRKGDITAADAIPAQKAARAFLVS